MRAFAEYLMRGRRQATLAVAATAAVPLLFWLSAAGAALVVLRRGVSDATSVLLWAALPALTWWWLGDSSVLLMMLGTACLAQVLRTTASWVWVLAVSVALGGVFAALLWMTSMPMVDALAAAVRELLPQFSAQVQMPEAERQVLEASLLPTLLGLLGAPLQLACVLCLMLARYWQAALYNPQGFAREFQALRLPKGLAIALLAGLLLSPLLAPELSVLVPLCTVPLLVSALALGHGLVAQRKLSSFWLVGLYLAALLLGNLLCLLAVLDSLLDVRGRLARKPSSTNGEG